MTKPKNPPSFWQRLWREFLEPIVFAVVITQFVVTLVGVDGASMMPNLRHHERVLVPKYESWLHKAGVGDFQRGDILVFKPPASAGVRSFFGLWNYRPFLIKRLVAVPGDTVRVENGLVYVNDELVDMSFTTAYWAEEGCWDTESEIANNALVASPYGLPETQDEVTIPEGHYYLMGDNRTVTGSEDSRLFGPVPLRDIAGRAAAVVWPIFRKEFADYDCTWQGPAPQDRIVYSGESQFNLRLLTRPEGFRELNAR